MYFLAIYIASLEKCLLKLFVHFWIELFGVCCCWVLGVSYIFWIQIPCNLQIISALWFANIFSYSVGCLFILCIVSFVVQNLNIFMRSNLFIFYFSCRHNIILKIKLTVNELTDGWVTGQGIDRGLYNQMGDGWVSFTISWSLLKFISMEMEFMSMESVMLSNHLILYHFLLLLRSIFPSIRVFFSESALLIRWPKYWSFSLSISPSNEYSGLISFRIDWFDLPAVQGTLIFSSTTIWKHQFFGTQSSLHPTLTSIYDYW